MRDDEVAGGARIALARLSASSVSASASAPAPASLALVCDVSGCGLSVGCVASSGVEAAGAESVGGAAADALVSAAVAAVGAVDASSMRGDDVDAAEAPEAPEASALPGVGRVPSLASSRASANDWLTSSLPSKPPRARAQAARPDARRGRSAEEGTRAWVKAASRRARENDAARLQREKDEEEQRVQHTYDAHDLHGLRVAHDLDELAGDERVLTLRDADVLDDREDELVDAALERAARDREKRAQAQKPRAYTGLDEDATPGRVLAKYDDGTGTDAPTSADTGFRLGDAASATPWRSARPPGTPHRPHRTRAPHSTCRSTI
ncbi:hypothetical protein CBS14141_003764 [Malassezia furfur]|nr:hypothetical protein CBS14141_003764 [Malassezia furfur]